MLFFKIRFEEVLELVKLLLRIEARDFGARGFRDMGLRLVLRLGFGVLLGLGCRGWELEEVGGRVELGKLSEHLGIWLVLHEVE